jgi:uncharacterized protein YbgA (DUF1722 family)
MDHFPLIPVEEEGRLQDPALREMFVEQMFTLRRLRDQIRQGKTRGNLVEFHTDHKLLILAHGRTRYAEMGRLVAHAKELPLEELYRRYLHLLMAALRLRIPPAKCADVLMHMMGHFRQFLTSDEKQELLLEMKRVVRPDGWKKRTEPDGPVLFHDVILGRFFQYVEYGGNFFRGEGLQRGRFHISLRA